MAPRIRIFGKQNVMHFLEFKFVSMYVHARGSLSGHLFAFFNSLLCIVGQLCFRPFLEMHRQPLSCIFNERGFVILRLQLRSNKVIVTVWAEPLLSHNMQRKHWKRSLLTVSESRLTPGICFYLISQE